MPFSRWIIAIAFGLIATFGWSQESVQGTENASSAEQAETSEDRRPSFVVALERIEAAIREAVSQESEEARQAQADQAAADLTAQREMARWAGAVFTFFDADGVGYAAEVDIRHRSGWIGDYLRKKQAGEYGHELFKQFPDDDAQ